MKIGVAKGLDSGRILQDSLWNPQILVYLMSIYSTLANIQIFVHLKNMYQIRTKMKYVMPLFYQKVYYFIAHLTILASYMLCKLAIQDIMLRIKIELV